MFKKALIFLIGGAIGFGTGYLISKKKFEEITKRDIEEFKKAVFENDYNPNKEVKETDEDNKEADKKVYKIKEKPGLASAKNVINYAGYSKPDEEKMKTEDKNIEKYKNYKNYNEEDEDIEETEEDSEEDISYPSPSEGASDNPYSISPEEFANENPYFDKITLMYYAGDNTLADEGDVIVTDDVLGGYFRNWFGEYEDGVAYVRNEKMGTDYEVLYMPGNYAGR